MQELKVKFQVEEYEKVIEEIKPYYNSHYEEVAADKEIELNPSYETYTTLALLGILHVVTVRNNDNNLIGYYIAIVTPHLHYKQSLTAVTDIYYLDPEYRFGRIAIDFFKFIESSLKDRGVQRIYTMTKSFANKGKIFEYLGYTEKERIYTKMIG